MRYATLGPLRHRCYACGKCCHGHAVPLLDDAEVARIEQAGRDLGVERPVVDGQLRFDQGACVFLGDDKLCSIHKAFGLEAKPLRCQEYPVRIVETEEETRLGVDPTCVNTWRSWRDGDLLGPTTIVRPRKWPANERPLEISILTLASQPDATVGGILHGLSGQIPTSASLPEGFATRWIQRLQEADVDAFLSHEEVGWGLRQPVAHIVARIAELDPHHVPAWPVITSEQEAFSLEILRRTLFLRNAPLLPGTLGAAVLTLGGAVLLGWSDPAPAAYGEGLSAWARCIEFRAFWLRLLPDPRLPMWLLHGRMPEEAP